MDRNLKSSTAFPWRGHNVISGPLSTCEGNRERHISRWAFQFSFNGRAGKLLGCTEDIRCHANPDRHSTDFEEPPYCRKLCPSCEVPVCSDCWGKLRNHKFESSLHDGGTIPMSLGNDHYYDHIDRFIVESSVTWLEGAACCMAWRTMLVYYLEAPYGNLIDVPLGKPEGRT